ncbi:hypothetical protein PTKU64_90650 (plasmid) [Paraburkholderia terrae]|uniref:Lipoprotein n=1 Tax=Paraburkholderia terrae TaxID=311230 RepID=A0ABN6JX32_9BURK|nr:hypothetical protein PTKU64_90650 [Paraburkholderia terrae]
MKLYLSMALLSIVCTSCAPIKFTPTQSDAVFLCQGPFQDPSSSNEFQIGYTGERSYETNGTVAVHSFIFDDPNDFVEVCITDKAGIDPGKGYPLTLKHVRKDGTPVVEKDKNWELTVVNLGTRALDSMCFKGAISGGQFDLQPATPVKGNWVVSKTDRSIAINIRFDVRNVIKPPFTKVLDPDCEPY